MTHKARVFVTLKPSVFDPQGRTIADALQSLGYATVADVRQGKYFELDLAVPSAAEAGRVAAEVADKLLANPVIESYRVEVIQEKVRPQGGAERPEAGRMGVGPHSQGDEVRPKHGAERAEGGRMGVGPHSQGEKT